MHLQPSGDLTLRMTVIAWKCFYADRQDWVIVPTVLPPLPVSAMTPTTNSLSGSPATVSTSYIRCCHLNVSSTTVYVSEAAGANYSTQRQKFHNQNVVQRLTLTFFFTTHPFYVNLIAFCLSFY